MSVAADLLGVYTARCAGGHGAGLEQFLPASRTVYYAYGRQALAEALRRGGVRPGDVVALPGLICREILASVAAMGALPRYYDVGTNLVADHAGVARAAVGARAIVAVNYFGFPQPLGPFRAASAATGAVLVEDNAHGFLSADESEPLGRRGDFGVFSLRKSLALPNGAALVDNREVPGASASGALRFDGSPRAAERRYRAKVLTKRLMAVGGVAFARTFVTVAQGLRASLCARGIAADTEQHLPAEAISPMALTALRRLDVAGEGRRRRTLYGQLRELLVGARDIAPVFGDLGTGVVPQGFPFHYTGGDPRELIAAWWRRGVFIHRWPELPRVLEAAAPAHYRSLMVAPFLW